MIAMETRQIKKKKKNNQNTNTTAASEKEAYLRVLRNCHPGIDLIKSCTKMVKEEKKKKKLSGSFSSTGTCHLESVMDIAVQEVVAANALVTAMSNVNKNTITGCIASGSGLTREQKKNLRTVGHGEM